MYPQADQEALEALLEQNRREHARRAYARDAVTDTAAVMPVQPSVAARKLLRVHALEAYASDLGALPRDRIAAERAALAKVQTRPISTLKERASDRRTTARSPQP